MVVENVDEETGNILDILSERTNYTIKNHFTGNYRRQDLRNVETVTIDMNAGYLHVIKEIFHQAKIIIDRFYLVLLITSSMKQTSNKINIRIWTSRRV